MSGVMKTFFGFMGLGISLVLIAVLLAGILTVLLIV